jgi:hypothetical protein
MCTLRILQLDTGPLQLLHVKAVPRSLIATHSNRSPLNKRFIQLGFLPAERKMEILGLAT